MEIDWVSMPHGVLVKELARGQKERDERIEQLEALRGEGAPRIETRGRKPRSSNGSEFPEHARGALDAEVTQ